MDEKCEVCKLSCRSTLSNYNDVVDSMLSKDLNHAVDYRESFVLHVAIIHGNESVTRHLLERESEINVNRRCHCGETPLSLAVNRQNLAIVNSLLTANADMNIADAHGKSPLHLVLNDEYENDEIRHAFYDKLKNDVSSVEELADKLIEAQCSLYQAVLFENTELSKCMINREIHIDSRNCYGETALHAAAELNDLKLVQWLANKGADVNALDDEDKGALFTAASMGYADIVEFLLERNACPNTEALHTQWTPLFAVFANSKADFRDEFDDCAQLLLQHGAIPQHPPGTPLGEIPDKTLYWRYYRADTSIAHLALLEILGMPNAQPVMFSNYEEKLRSLPKFQEIYEKCRMKLETKIFKELSLGDLLTFSDGKMRNHARNENFVSEVKDCGLSYSHRYYSKLLMRRILKASQIVKLETTAVEVLCRILGGNHNQNYYIARRIVGYLGKSDLENVYRLEKLKK